MMNFAEQVCKALGLLGALSEGALFAVDGMGLFSSKWEPLKRFFIKAANVEGSEHLPSGPG